MINTQQSVLLVYAVCCLLTPLEQGQQVAIHCRSLSLGLTHNEACHFVTFIIHSVSLHIFSVSLP